MSSRPVTAVIDASSTVAAADRQSVDVQAAGAHSLCLASAVVVGSSGVPARVSRRLLAKRQRPDSPDSSLQSSLTASLPTPGSATSADSLQSHDSRKRNNSMRRAYSSVARGNHACTDCGTSVTPVWCVPCRFYVARFRLCFLRLFTAWRLFCRRAGPHGKSTLCNACGVSVTHSSLLQL